MTDPDRPCPHDSVITTADFLRITATADGHVTGYRVDVRIVCAEPLCAEAFEWLGMAAGVSPLEPTTSLDRLELRAPLRPATLLPESDPA